MDFVDALTVFSAVSALAIAAILLSQTMVATLFVDGDGKTYVELQNFGPAIARINSVHVEDGLHFSVDVTRSSLADAFEAYLVHTGAVSPRPVVWSEKEDGVHMIAPRESVVLIRSEDETVPFFDGFLNECFMRISVNSFGDQVLRLNGQRV